MISRWLLLSVLVFASPALAVKIVVTVPHNTPADAVIYLAGPEEGGWKPDALKLAPTDEGRYAGDIRDGRTLPYPYKITRGSWSTVEKAKDGSELPNRELPADVEGEVQITVERWADAGGDQARRVSTATGNLRLVEIDKGDAKRTVRVWLPPDYESNAQGRYPVLYMQDGQNCFDAATSAFGHEWRIDETLTTLIGERSIAPLIVVAIDNAGERRIDEYTPHFDRGRGGKGEEYERFVVETVKPYIDANFRTRPQREHTFAGGSSLGGLISLDMARRYDRVFGGAMALSPSLWWAGEALTADFGRDADPHRPRRLFVSMGAREGGEPEARARYTEQVERFGRIVSGKNTTVRVMIDPEGEHNEASWARQFPEAIRHLLPPDR